MTVFSEPSFDPFAVLKAIKGYAASFFGCTECAKHFQDMVTRELPMDEWVCYFEILVRLLSAKILL